MDLETFKESATYIHSLLINMVSESQNNQSVIYNDNLNTNSLKNGKLKKN